MTMLNSPDTELTPVKGFKINIRTEVLQNENFRKLLYTGNHLQLVSMSLGTGEELGEEIHNANDQFFRFESGQGLCIINGHEYHVLNGDAIVIPAGAKHNVINVSATDALKMYTIYAPPHHKDGITRQTKKDTFDNPEKFDGQTSE